MPPVVIAKDIYKCYAGFAPVLRGASLEVEPGEMVAIMGPSGCGKSTMLHILGLLHAPDAGALEILGTNVLKLDREQTAAFRRGNIGFVMQSSNLFEHSTVFENVEFPLIYENVPPQERWERVIRALDLVRLSARVHYRSNRLSGGEQQRVAIARAMVNNPRILMADEPTGALDARTSRLVMENFRTLCHSGGVSMIMVTHDPKMAEYCDSVYTLEDGLLVTKKHEVPKISPRSHTNFLKPPEPVARGALIAWRFPQKNNYRLLALAGRLHSLNLLSRIYAISPGGFLGNPEGYSLPLAVRRVGFWQNFFSFTVMFHRARRSESLWSLWRQLPARHAVGFNLFSRLRAFADGVYLARWGLEDNIQYFYAAGAGREATAAWVAARLLRLPFLFEITARNLAEFGPDDVVKTRSAAFVVCSTAAEAAELRRHMPELPRERIVLARNLPPVSPQEDESETSGQGVMPASILAPDARANPRAFNDLLSACASLGKTGINFRLSIPGPKSWKMRWKVFGKGLRSRATFLGDVPMDRLGETFRTADIVVAAQPRGLELAMPEELCEAMAYGTAVIACGPGPGMMEILRDGENALIVPVGDINALSGAIEKLVSDLSLRKRLGENARKDLAAWLDVDSANRLLADRIAEIVGLSERARMSAMPGNAERPEA